MTCWDSGGIVIPCAGTGQDGEIQAGATLAYVDNGDGTVTDVNTGLQWEKKSDDGSIHDKDVFYTWSNALAVHVSGLNTANFAGHNDWRLPNVRELQSIVNYENYSPAVSSAFNTGCTGGCAVTACSCTAPSDYWSSTSLAASPGNTWHVDFIIGRPDLHARSNSYNVRAVRG
jgi:hypothetical protein